MQYFKEQEYAVAGNLNSTHYIVTYILIEIAVILTHFKKSIQ